MTLATLRVWQLSSENPAQPIAVRWLLSLFGLVFHGDLCWVLNSDCDRRSAQTVKSLFCVDSAVSHSVWSLISAKG